MSVFVNHLKTFKTKITGEERELKIVAGVWLFLEADYGIKQGNFNEKIKEEEAITLAKLVCATFKANKIDVSLDDVLTSADDVMLAEFYLDYISCLHGGNDTEKKEKKVLTN